jgi:hypothetical protein
MWATPDSISKTPRSNGELFAIGRWAFNVIWSRDRDHFTPCNAAASCADALSFVCGACAWQFLLFVFF